MLIDRVRGGAALLALALCAAVPATPVSAQSAEPDVPWESGPVDGLLGKQSRVRVGEACLFTGEDGTRMFLTLTENPTNGSERGTVLCTIPQTADEEDHWFAVFEYDKSGYVKDDERGSLDADGILASLRKGNEAANKIRRQRGWATLETVGWERAPFYDPETNNLTWAVRIRDETGAETINHSVRLLGREGVMSVDLVVDPKDYQAALAGFGSLIAAHEYNAGFKYAEWREGDKVAAYGLTALVAGGAGVLAAKTGLLGKFWKVLVGIGVAIVAGIKRLFGGRSTARA